MFVCLSVCRQDISESYWRIWTKFCGVIDVWSRTDRWDLATDPLILIRPDLGRFSIQKAVHEYSWLNFCGRDRPSDKEHSARFSFSLCLYVCMYVCLYVSVYACVVSYIWRPRHVSLLSGRHWQLLQNRRWRCVERLLIRDSRWDISVWNI